jgi:hypothetical protein
MTLMIALVTEAARNSETPVNIHQNRLLDQTYKKTAIFTHSSPSGSEILPMALFAD